MSGQQKAIRSSGWKTDFIIGFPEGLLLVFFTTMLIQGLPVTVQQFYTLNTVIWAGGAVLVSMGAYLANRGDTQHNESHLSAAEKSKLENLDIGEGVIADIAAEMAKDAEQWEKTLQTENVVETAFSRSRAVRSAFFTGLFFLLGGILPLLPYLRDENFSVAAKSSVVVAFLVMTVFSFLKARMTSQSVIPVILRNLFYIGAVWVGAYVLQLIFR
ncbi:VIT1/CCC1 transporter family protein [Chitinophaga tropicalis]|uniref:VIT family protein n=1 Tax=Chitinophaga tropicalis TaxID=2683588 RepID=A0A7K1UA37_9BACT|nr:VIT1/CCC1 transporter family protein [Chitinophaga tropicalis]MVT11232.1 hypothetical protein [Chitinophaga tropicalis]